MISIKAQKVDFVLESTFETAVPIPPITIAEKANSQGMQTDDNVITTDGIARD